MTQELWTMPRQVLQLVLERILKFSAELWRHDVPCLWGAKMKIVDGEEILVFRVPTGRTRHDANDIAIAVQQCHRAPLQHAGTGRHPEA